MEDVDKIILCAYETSAICSQYKVAPRVPFRPTNKLQSVQSSAVPQWAS
jgi:hypothetical protein